MANASKTKQSHFVCFHCRKMFRKTLLRFNYGGTAEGKEDLRCAECGEGLVNVGRGFEPPRRHDVKSWRRLELMHAKPKNWLAAADGGGSSFRIVGSLKYHAKPPRQAEDRSLVDRAKDLKKQRQSQKLQDRLASRSRTGPSLTSVSESDRRP